MRFITSALIICTLTACLSMRAGRGEGSQKNRIDALVSAPQLVVYSDDGAADASVLAIYERGDGSIAVGPVPEVRSLVEAGPSITPLLIEHLDDIRPTSAKFGRNNPQRVPVGHVCLDILLHIIGNSPHVFIEDCGDDGLGACIKDGFYFRPDDYERTEHGVLPRPVVREVKSNWERAYREGKIKFDYVVRWK